MYNSKYYTCNLSNININASRLLYASGGNNKNFKFNMDNCSYFKTSSLVAADLKDAYTFYFESTSSFDANITNSLFYFPEGLLDGNTFLRCHGKSGGGVHNVTIENCDIIAKTSQKIFTTYSSVIVPTVQYINCRIYDSTADLSYTTYLGDGTLYTSSLHKDSTTTVIPGYVSTTVTKVIPYTVPATTLPAIGANGLSVFGTDTADIEVSFAYEVRKCSEVEESFDDVRLSMLYYSNFNMVLYVEANEAATITTLTEFTAAGSVKIDGKEYYAFIKECTTTGVSDDVTAKLTYKIDGKTYRQTFVVSALLYADLVLSNTTEELEKAAVANMVRFIKEARTAAGLAIPAELTEVEALYTLDPYKDKAEYDDLDVDASPLEGTSLAFAISASNADYVIKPTSETAVVTVKYVGGEQITVTKAADENAWYTSGERIYDLVGKAIEITITDGDASVTGTYSVGAYINGTDNALAKAMYEFGVAAKAYREYLETL
jgi:hypothetical protein